MKKLYSEYDNKVNIDKYKSAKKTNKMFSNRIPKVLKRILDRPKVKEH